MVFLFVKWVKLTLRARCKKCFFLLSLLTPNFISNAVPILGGSAIKHHMKRKYVYKISVESNSYIKYNECINYCLLYILFDKYKKTYSITVLVINK